MKYLSSFNVLKVQGLANITSIKDCYLATLQLIHTEFPRGYVEPRVLLFLLYGSHSESSQQFFISRLPPEATCFFIIPWDSPHCLVQLRILFSLLHLCFGLYPNILLDEFSFAEAYNEFEEWRICKNRVSL